MQYGEYTILKRPFTDTDIVQAIEKLDEKLSHLNKEEFNREVIFKHFGDRLVSGLDGAFMSVAVKYTKK